MDPLATRSAPAATPIHLVELYEQDEQLTEAAGTFLAEALMEGGGAIWIGIARHREPLQESLRGHGVEVARAQHDGRLVLLDAGDTLATFMVDGWPDPARFEQNVASVVRSTIERCGGSVRAFGEMVDVLWRDGRRDAALLLETMWETLQTREPFSLLCAYAIDGFPTPLEVRSVCEAHDHVGVPRAPSSTHRKTTLYASDIARRLTAERALEWSHRELDEHRDLLADCLENAAIGLHFVGPDGTILWANRTELELLGYDEQEYIGRNIADFHVDDRRSAEILDRLTRGETLRDEPARLRAKNGAIKHVEIDSNSLRRNGQFVHTRCFTRDVTERVRRTRIDRLLADATALLASSRDPYATLRQVVELSVEHLGGACLLQVINAVVDVQYVSTNASHREWEAALLQWVQLRPRASVRADLLRLSDSDPFHSLGAKVCVRVPLRGPDGAIGAFVVVLGADEAAFADSTLQAASVLTDRVVAFVENARLYREAREAREQAESASRAKDRFLAMLGHELRNPMAPILLANTIVRERCGERVRAECDVIERQVSQLVRLVDDLLDVSRVTKGLLQLERIPIELSTIVAAALEMSGPLVTSREHRLMTDVPPTGLCVDADPDRLAQVVHNLVGNAAKFTAPGGVIEVVAFREDDRAVIEVRDNGVGISAEALATIWEPFMQVGSGRPHESGGGLGLGLAIVKAIVELHDGRARVDSDGPGLGSRFVIDLPLAADASAAPERRIQHAAAPAPRMGGRALVVDDNEDAAEMLAELLRARGFTTIVATTGVEALRVASTFAPHVALLDIGMPGMDGYALAAELRRSPATAQTKLMALTGYGQATDRERSLSMGFDEHVVKPVSADRIAALVRELVRDAANAPPSDA